MPDEIIRRLLEQVKDGEIAVSDALDVLRKMPFEDLDFAKIDHHRALRCGAPEVIFCQGKTPEQVVSIAGTIFGAGRDVLATRANDAVAAAMKIAFPDVEHNAAARTLVLQRLKKEVRGGLILIITAGTSDIPVAEEARVTAQFLGNNVECVYDCGVAGIHRLLRHYDNLSRANVLIVVAGMEGALASVVGGLVARPVIAVPTSVGYGAHFQGLAPLLSMLNSCAAGVAVVNIDNGFGAAHMASLINQTGCARSEAASAE
ncbi:MAG TPA: nickel pincer cofactor biosynthesis protein LarB [Candidatus Brocadiia bacterium]|nr:nickel pincer cofactor biosynthesis protein LarB [Candidatus Brocadiia bacterium]